MKKNKVIIGVTQFGLNYGLDARKSNFSRKKIKELILRFFKGENLITKENFLFLEKRIKSKTFESN